MARRQYGLYIHVPFCGSICSYCHFARTADHDPAIRRAFVSGALTEMALRLERCPTLWGGQSQLATVYIGGGTPSQLETGLMADLIAGTVGRLTAAPDLEFTAEANPETLDRAKAEAWLEAGINRVSLGVQSLKADVLRQLGRSCDPVTARRALKLASEMFPRVSADWIIGPGLKEGQLLDELTEAVELGIGHFSLYILEVHPGTRLAADLAGGQLKLPPDRHTEALYLAAGQHLESLGVGQYEVANFSRPGLESRHNQGYWRGVPWLALGPSAHGFWGKWRYANHQGTEAWLKDLQSGRLPVAEVDHLDRRARRLEQVILSLRTRAGLPLAWLPDGVLDLARGQAEGLWNLDAGRLVLTRRGFLRIDSLENRLAGSL